MKFLSHRGYWKTAAEKNTEIAFTRSFSLNFGTETDVRDANNELCISHDIATGNELSFDAFLQLANTNSAPLTLALNVKADGLARPMRRVLDAYPALDCFVFDMSVPDMRSYFEAGIPVFTRMSEVERQPVWLDRSAGVWLDGFESEWYETAFIEELLKQKRVCVVSPELHGRSHLVFWERIKHLVNESRLMLCTDYPQEAAKFFLSN